MRLHAGRRPLCRLLASARGPAGNSPRRATFFLSDQKEGKKSPLFRRPSRSEGFPAMLERRGSRGTRFATLRSDSRAKSDVDACCARASPFCASRLLQRGVKEQPTAKPGSRLPRGIRLAPFSTAEQRKALRACAKRTSTTDSVRLYDRSVAEGVPHGPSRPEQRREPAALLRAVRSGGALCLLSGGPESRSPAGAKTAGFAEGKSRRDATGQTYRRQASCPGRLKAARGRSAASRRGCRWRR